MTSSVDESSYEQVENPKDVEAKPNTEAKVRDMNEIKKETIEKTEKTDEKTSPVEKVENIIAETKVENEKKIDEVKAPVVEEKLKEKVTGDVENEKEELSCLMKYKKEILLIALLGIGITIAVVY